MIEINFDFEIVVCIEKWFGEKSIYGIIYSFFFLLILYVLFLGIIFFFYIRIWSKFKNYVSFGVVNDYYYQRR